MTSWLKGAWDTVISAKRNDILICVYDFQGVICFWLSEILQKKLNILAINILLKDKRTTKNRIATFLYRKALNNMRFLATATTEEYGTALKKRLGLKYSIPLLRDVFYSSYDNVKCHKETKETYIFCGGRNGRNWELMAEIARNMPDIKFIFALPLSEKQRLYPTSDNVEYLFDISIEKFNNLMVNASIVALPLDTEAPAGLIVLFQSAACNKPVVISSTISTREYIDSQRGVAVENDVSSWIQELRELLSDPDRCKLLGVNLNTFLHAECSEDKYVGRISQLLKIHFPVHNKAPQ